MHYVLKAKLNEYDFRKFIGRSCNAIKNIRSYLIEKNGFILVELIGKQIVTMTFRYFKYFFNLVIFYATFNEFYNPRELNNS